MCAYFLNPVDGFRFSQLHPETAVLTEQPPILRNLCDASSHLQQCRVILIGRNILPARGLNPPTIKVFLAVRVLRWLYLRFLLFYTRMGPLRVLRIALVSILFFTSANGDCTNPKVRREWRTLDQDEHVSWINAVKVILLA